MTEYTNGLLVLTIAVLDDEDYDHNPCQIKQAAAEIDGVRVPVEYSFEGDELDENIRIAVEQDLTDRGYTWIE